MNVWLAVGVLVVVLLVGVVLFGTHRPRGADDILGQLPQKVPPVDTAHPLTQRSLADALHSLQAGRQTGTLNVTSGDRTASLYFLFGHLFHAVNLSLTGEAAVRECLAWHDVQYGFDKVSPLPTAETIERPIDQILAA